MNDAPMINELRRLREQCVVMMQRIDAILPEVEELASPVGHDFPLVVAGRCERISQHALDCWRERTGSKKSDASVMARIAENMGNAREMLLHKKYLVLEMIAHGQHSRFFNLGDMIYVVEEGMIVTIQKWAVDRWYLKPEAPTP